MQAPSMTKCAPCYLPHIDGLRGISVLAILLFHLDITFFGGGFVGVDVFFIISGFLITQLIAREIGSGTFSFANFYARRIKRIFPALFVMLFITSLAAILFLGAREYSQFF
jgi:peptidoglycan/LPS O-acetylase OafA/YrhL